MTEWVQVNQRRVRSSEVQVSGATGKRYIKLYRPFIRDDTQGWILFRTDEVRS